jgi:Tfp pilus assembly protein PilZ
MATARSGGQTIEQRRSSGMLRVPFVRRCQLEFERGRTATAFVVNLNVLGAYVASDDMPLMGEPVICRFATPDNEIEVVADGVVAWVNPHQSHPVHSLPPGFGIRFERLTNRDRARIEATVRGYIERHAQERR